MRVDMNTITPNVRDLPVSLKLQRHNKYDLPLDGSNGYIINPKKFENEAGRVEINVEEIKALLLMMLKGNPKLISQLVKTDDSKFVNTVA
ncbi:MAG: hypothetical protein PHF84_04915 [bacterium]|nr:hypothetical protein [bacterium]